MYRIKSSNTKHLYHEKINSYLTESFCDTKT